MDDDKDYLAKYELKEDKVNEALQHKDKIRGLKNNGEELNGKRSEHLKEIGELNKKESRTPEEDKRFEKLTEEVKSVDGEIAKNDFELGAAEKNYEKFKEDNPGLAEEADYGTVESGYRGETGRDLDKNVGGYDTFQQEDTSKPLDESSKEAARKAVSGMNLDQEGNEQENNTPDQEPMQEEQETESQDIEIESYDEKLDPEQQAIFEEKRQEIEQEGTDQTKAEIAEEIQEKLDQYREEQSEQEPESVQEEQEQPESESPEPLEAEEGPLADYPAEEPKREVVGVVKDKEQEQDDQER